MIIFHSKLDRVGHQSQINAALFCSEKIAERFNEDFIHKTYKNENFCLSDNTIIDTRRFCILENTENGKIIIFNYGIRKNQNTNYLFDILRDRIILHFHNQINENKFDYNMKTYPFFHIPFKENNTLDFYDEPKINKGVFRGSSITSSIRKEIFNNYNKIKYPNIDIINSKDSKLSFIEYIKELDSYKYGISFIGFGNNCHRDAEVLSRKRVLICSDKVNYLNPLIDGYNCLMYSGNDYETILTQINNIILKTTKEEYIYIAENGFKWYNECCNKENIGDFVMSKFPNEIELFFENTGLCN